METDVTDKAHKKLCCQLLNNATVNECAIINWTNISTYWCSYFVSFFNG